MLLVKGSSYERYGCKRPLYYAEQNGKSVEGLFIYSRQKGTDASRPLYYTEQNGKSVEEICYLLRALHILK